MPISAMPGGRFHCECALQGCIAAPAKPQGIRAEQSRAAQPTAPAAQTFKEKGDWSEGQGHHTRGGQARKADQHFSNGIAAGLSGESSRVRCALLCRRPPASGGWAEQSSSTPLPLAHPPRHTPRATLMTLSRLSVNTWFKWESKATWVTLALCPESSPMRRHVLPCSTCTHTCYHVHEGMQVVLAQGGCWKRTAMVWAE